MTALKVVLTVLHLIIAFGLMATVLFQSSKTQGLTGSIAGGAETFFGKNKGKTMDGVLAKLTVVLAILFVVTSVSLSLLSKKVSVDAQVQEPVELVTEEAPVEEAPIEEVPVEEAPVEEAPVEATTEEAAE